MIRRIMLVDEQHPDEPLEAEVEQLSELVLGLAVPNTLTRFELHRLCATPSTSPPRRTGAPPGVCIVWRFLAGQDARLDAERFGEALRLLGLPKPGDVASLVGELRELAPGAGDPVTLAAQAARRAYRFSPGPEGEVFALWAADLLLALRLGWERPAPLLVTKILDPSLRAGPAGARPRPNDFPWPQAVASAYVLAAGDAHALASELSRRREKLLTFAPKLRAKRASRVVELLLTEDCVAASRAANFFGLSDRAARRLFDRLVELEAVREVSGRTAFRLYGL